MSRKDEKEDRWPPEDFVSKSSKYVISADKNEVIKSMRPVLQPKMFLPIPRLTSNNSTLGMSLPTKQSNQTQKVILTEHTEERPT